MATKPTARIPKSRSKYLMQFLKRKGGDSADREAIDPEKWVTIYSSVSGAPHRRGNSTQVVSNAVSNNEYYLHNQYNDAPIDEYMEESKYKTPQNPDRQNSYRKW